MTLRAYERHAADYGRGDDDRGWLVPVLDQFLAMVRPGGIVLDLGCGPGREAFELAERGVRVVGLDIASSLLGRAHREHPVVGYVRGDMRHSTRPETGASTSPPAGSSSRASITLKATPRTSTSERQDGSKRSPAGRVDTACRAAVTSSVTRAEISTLIGKSRSQAGLRELGGSVNPAPRAATEWPRESRPEHPSRVSRRRRCGRRYPGPGQSLRLCPYACRWTGPCPEPALPSRRWGNTGGTA
jgi:SAM-dependent methyltransferase